jgi:DNA-binding NarL/FixJ family response regulator
MAQFEEWHLQEAGGWSQFAESDFEALAHECDRTSSRRIVERLELVSVKEPLLRMDRTGASSETGKREDIRVLIAHSDALISAGLIAALREQQFSVLAELPDSGDRSPTHSRPGDVTIADYESALHRLNSQEVRRERVIVLTGRDSQASICHALEQGAWGYLLLGCSVADVVNGIRLVQAGTRALGPLVAARLAERVTLPLLTDRESKVLGQITLGLSNKRIASELLLSVGTVKSHVKAILAKLGASSRTHAVAMARRYGIHPEEGDGIPSGELIRVPTLATSLPADNRRLLGASSRAGA